MDEENDPTHINLSIVEEKNEFVMSSKENLRQDSEKKIKIKEDLIEVIVAGETAEDENVAKDQEPSEQNIIEEGVAKQQVPSEQKILITEDTAEHEGQSEQNTMIRDDIAKHQTQSEQITISTENIANLEQSKQDTEDIAEHQEHPEEIETTTEIKNQSDILNEQVDKEQVNRASELDNDNEIDKKGPNSPEIQELQDLKVVKEEDTYSIEGGVSKTSKDNVEIENEVKENEKVTAEEPKPEKIEEEASEEVVDPSAPYNLRHSVEDIRRPYKLPQEVEEEVQRLWETFQNCTPSYSDIDGYITLKELPYMLKSILLMTYTPEQLMEVVDFICGEAEDEKKGIRITYEQFLAIVKMRHRVFDVEEELREALNVLDPKKTGQIDGVKLKEILGTQGHKMPSKMIHKFIKEVDLTGDGIIGTEDIVAICGIELPPRETSAEIYNMESTEQAVEEVVEDNATERASMNTVTTTVTTVTETSALTDSM